MKKNLKIAFIFIVAIFALRICLSNDKKKVNNLLVKSPNADNVTINITPNISNTTKINRNIFGINIGFAFADELDKDSGFVQLLRDLKPASLRFPGGTVGNWYHPNLPVYGFKKEEMSGKGGWPLYNLQSKRSENILFNLIRLCKATNCGVVYCANLQYGTFDEFCFVIDELKKNNIPLYGLELGNEYNLMGYRKLFPDVNAYIKKIKQTAIDLRKKYPDLRIAVVGGDPNTLTAMDMRSKFMRDWNLQLGKENFFDGYVWHTYNGCTTCDNNTFFDSVYIKNNYYLMPTKNNFIEKESANLKPLYDSIKKLWITEWNVGNLPMLENTFVQGAYVSDFFLSVLDINSKTNNYIELTNLHALGGLITFGNGKIKAFKTIGRNKTTYEYYAFQFLTNTLSTNSFRCSENVTSDAKDVLKQFTCYTFLNKDDNKVYLHFVNHSNKNITLNINANIKSAGDFAAMEADFPYSAAGKTQFENEKEYTSKLNAAKLVNRVLTNKAVQIAPYSFGYISYSN
jgi:hypothetical protein